MLEELIVPGDGRAGATGTAPCPGRGRISEPNIKYSHLYVAKFAACDNCDKPSWSTSTLRYELALSKLSIQSGYSCCHGCNSNHLEMVWILLSMLWMQEWMKSINVATVPGPVSVGHSANNRRGAQSIPCKEEIKSILYMHRLPGLLLESTCIITSVKHICSFYIALLLPASHFLIVHWLQLFWVLVRRIFRYNHTIQEYDISSCMFA